MRRLSSFIRAGSTPDRPIHVHRRLLLVDAEPLHQMEGSDLGGDVPGRATGSGARGPQAAPRYWSPRRPLARP